MDIQTALRNTSLKRCEINPGFVCQVKDELIRMPDKEEGRTIHYCRHVLIMSCNFLCAAREINLVTFAPLSTDMSWENPAEVRLKPTRTNGLTAESRVMLAHLQPIHKVDVEKKLGELSLAEWDDVMTQVVKNFDRA